MATYFQPRKAILTKEQLEAFQTSKPHQMIMSFIEALNDAVVGMRLTDDIEMSEAVRAVMNILDQVEQIAKDTPPVENKASRFGNPAFRTFYDKISEVSPSLHSTLPNLPSESIVEISTYFNEAWGNRARIDYGSGMELNFLCWLICLRQLQVLTDEDNKAVVIRAFWRYIQVMRVLQSTYWLEPAGSHGVWGLDDYHFLPFLLGSAQLKGHKYIRPKAIHDAEVVEEYSKHYIYFACIQFINSIKTASLRWHSPMLDDISAVKTWDKVNAGMLKMYRAEVLDKLPVIQHFLFGSILAWDGPTLPPFSEVYAHWDHDHDHGHAHQVSLPPISDSTTVAPFASTSGDKVYPLPSSFPVPARPQTTATDDLGGAGQREVGWGDCCGIPVPSVFGAAQAERGKEGKQPGSRLSGAGIRPVPFD